MHALGCSAFWWEYIGIKNALLLKFWLWPNGSFGLFCFIFCFDIINARQSNMMRNPLHEEGSLNILQKISQFSKEGQEIANSTREETGFFLGHLFFLPRIQVKLAGNSAFRVLLWAESRQNYFHLSPVFIMYTVCQSFELFQCNFCAIFTSKTVKWVVKYYFFLHVSVSTFYFS